MNYRAASPDVTQDLAPRARCVPRSTWAIPFSRSATRTPANCAASRSTSRAELSRRLNLPVEFVTFDAAGKVFAAFTGQRLGRGIPGDRPKRAAEIEFTAPYVIIEGSYLVPAVSPLRFQRRRGPGRRAQSRSATAVRTSSTSPETIKHAQILRAPTGAEATALFERDKLEVLAGVRSPLVKFAQARPDLRVMDGRFMVIEQAMGCPRAAPPERATCAPMLEELKASGFVAAGLARSGQRDALVAPAAASGRENPA